MKLFEIKIGGKTDTAGLDAFFTEFHNETAANPFQPRMSIWKDTIGIEMSKFGGKAHMSSIMSFEKKNAGQASAALKWLCELADKHNVTMDLIVSPIKNAGAVEGKSLTKSQLTAWYAKNGFVKTRNDTMERTPKKE